MADAQKATEFSTSTVPSFTTEVLVRFADCDPAGVRGKVVLVLTDRREHRAIAFPDGLRNRILTFVVVADVSEKLKRTETE